MLTNDEDRERRAKHGVPGSYYVVLNPGTFSSLEEYRASQDEDSKTRQNIYEDADTLILGEFETSKLFVTRFEDSSSSSLNLYPSAASYMTSQEETPVLSTAQRIEEDRSVVAFYCTTVRKILDEIHHDTLGTYAQSGMQTIPDILEQRAAHSIPVSDFPNAISDLFINII